MKCHGQADICNKSAIHGRDMIKNHIRTILKAYKYGTQCQCNCDSDNLESDHYKLIISDKPPLRHVLWLYARKTLSE
jgi:hypothetical protein